MRLWQTRDVARTVEELLPRTMSQCCVGFVESYRQTQNFVFFVTEVVTRSDETRRIAIEALLHGASPEERQRLEEDRAKGNTATNALRRYAQLILETIITRTVDNYLTYVAELLATVFRTRPEMLRSAEQVPLEFVLKHDNMDDLLGALAERRVERLAYSGMGRLAKDLEDTIGFSLFDSPGDLERAMRLVEDRNLIVHNRAVVNSTYLRRLPGSGRRIGERLVFDVNATFADVDFLAKMAVLADVRATEKWSLPVVPFGLERRPHRALSRSRPKPVPRSATTRPPRV